MYSNLIPDKTTHLISPTEDTLALQSILSRLESSNKDLSEKVEDSAQEMQEKKERKEAEAKIDLESHIMTNRCVQHSRMVEQLRVSDLFIIFIEEC